MYGLIDHNPYNQALGTACAPTLGDRDLKLQAIRQKLYSHENSFRMFCNPGIAELLNNGILTRDEARTILDIENLLKTIEEAKMLAEV